MVWTAAIERNREALKQVLAGLLSMTGFAGGADHPATLPRILHRAVLRLLRPAEAAVRRLVIVAARGLAETVPQVQPRNPRAKLPSVRAARGFRLFDPPTRFGRPRQKSPAVLPRVSFPGFGGLSPVRQPPLPFDPIDTTPLAQRLAALASTLDDLPRQARRFSRWQARLDAARNARPSAGEKGRLMTHDAKAAARRVWPLRPGHPPGRLSPGDRRPAHQVHELLTNIHGLALWALEPPDTS